MKEAVEIERNTSIHPITPGDLRPAIELLGDMFLELDQPNKALAAYEENLKGSPNRFNGIYGAAIAAQQSGEKEKATMYFQQLLKVSESSNGDRPELKEAQTYLGLHTI